MVSCDFRRVNKISDEIECGTVKVGSYLEIRRDKNENYDQNNEVLNER